MRKVRTQQQIGEGERNEGDPESNRRESASSELMNILVTVC